MWRSLFLVCMVWQVCRCDVIIPDCVVDVGFVLDGSGSVGADNWQVIRDYVAEFAAGLTIGLDGSLIGVVTFGNEASLEIRLDEFTGIDELQAAIQNLYYRDQNTNTAAGIREARNELFSAGNGDRDDAPDILIIITDGYPTWEVEQTLPEAMYTLAEGIEIFTIGVGSQINTLELYMMANNISDHTFLVTDFQDLSSELNLVLGATCEVAVVAPVGDIVPGSICAADIAFVLDGSGSVGQDNWDAILDFLVTFAETIMVEDFDTHIGVVTYGNEASVQVDFTTGSNLESFVAAAPLIPYRNENTNTAAGLRVARTELFTVGSGARDGYQQIMIVLTDGVATYEVDQTLPEAQLALDAGILILTVSVGDMTDPVQLYMLTGNRTSLTLQVDNFDELVGNVEDLVFSTCFADPTECVLDLALVLDASGSIGSTEWDSMKMFGSSLLDYVTLSPDLLQVALVTYSSEAGVEFLLNTYNTTSEHQEAIEATPSHGQRTNIADALMMTRDQVFQVTAGDRESVPNLVLLVTDGRSNVNVGLEFEQAALLQAEGARIVAVGVGEDADMAELRQIASSPETFFLRLYYEMAEMISDAPYLIEDICEFAATITAPAIDISAYPFDIVFLIGTSGGGQDDWDMLVEYVASLLVIHDGQLGDFNIGVYSGASGDSVALGQYSGVSDMAQAVRSLANPGPMSATSDAISYLRQVLDASDSGNMQSIVIVTDGLDEAEASNLGAATLLARNDGIHVTVLAAGYYEATLMEAWYMEGIASEPYEEHQFFFDTMEELVEMDIFPIIAFMGVTAMSTCDFEEDSGESTLCGGTQSNTDDFDWTLHSGGTPSRHTGPDEAYTGEYYAFIEASSPRQPEDMAELILPFTVEGASESTMCLQFMYHMKGFHIGLLQVVLTESGREHLRWQLNGPQGEDWLLASVPLVLTAYSQISIRGIVGQAFSGDIGIDNIRLMASPCVLSLP